MKKKISAWGNYPSTETEFIQPPFYELNMPSQGFIPQGNLRSYGDCALSSTTVSLLNHNKILNFFQESGVIECQSGILFSDLLDFCVHKKFFLSVTPGTKFITLGGAIASDVHGKNHHKDGSFSSFVISFTLLLPDKTTITCSREENSELFWLTFGGMGLTGIVLTAKIKLRPIETSYIHQTTYKARNLKEIMSLFEKHKDVTYSVAWIDCLSKGKKLGRSLLMVGEHANYNNLPKKLKKSYLGCKTNNFSVPFFLPQFVLNTYTVKLFNNCFYNKQIKRIKEDFVDLNTFFYPLDSVLKWNRIYGKKGFVQYQCVIPYDKSYQGIKKIIEHISKNGAGSFLAVLKLFGEQDSLISFPMKGYTLALDFPVNKKTFALLSELDGIVLSLKGRVYLAKDSRMSEEMFHASYSNSDTFFVKLKKYFPNKNYRSLQSERMGY